MYELRARFITNWENCKNDCWLPSLFILSTAFIVQASRRFSDFQWVVTHYHASTMRSTTSIRKHLRVSFSPPVSKWRIVRWPPGNIALWTCYLFTFFCRSPSQLHSKQSAHFCKGPTLVYFITLSLSADSLVASGFRVIVCIHSLF
jgi:hypothetical protein